jgi:hypothetical protein
MLRKDARMSLAALIYRSELRGVTDGALDLFLEFNPFI